ncbi:MAG: multidrug DMT transporter permease [Ignavibacteriae bacterium HGW-Ignavibacteriae-2]|nr:MAG: multidrug DMT transporter permease [Ignavibacteriae bacterium HGW-Ignavibacteriae-2]
MIKITEGKYFGEAVMLLVTLLWGATFVIVKESLHDVSSMLFIAIRFSIAAFLLIPILLKIKKKITRESLFAGLVIGVLLFAGFATQTVGLKFTTATKSGFLTGTAVVMVPLFQIIIEKRKPSVGSVIGVVIVFIGILMLSSGGNSIFSVFSELGGNFNLGDFLTLICALFFALYIIYVDYFTKKHDHWILILAQVYVTSLLAFLFAFSVSAADIEPIRLELSNYLLFGIFYTSVFATLITTVLQTKFQKLITPTKASIIFSFEPVFAAVFAFFLLNEKITNLGLIGAVLIFAGLIISEVLDNFLIRKNVI